VTEKQQSHRKLRRRLKNAASYDEWQNLADELDRRLALDAWRANRESSEYHHELLQFHIDRLREHREAGAYQDIVDLLYQALYRHLGDITARALYDVAHGGTKNIIDTFLRESELALRALCDEGASGLSNEDKLTRFEVAAQNFGRSALLLSGGATLGFYHLGVARALWSQGLLPRVISGSSMGAIIAAAICCRTDQELGDWFPYPERIDAKGLGLASFRAIIARRALLDQERLLENVRHSCGDYTFAEAYARTGRVLNITVSPTRSRQKPRLLNYRTAPDVLISHACIASSAVPGLFPPVTLRRRNADGGTSPYMPTETWVDGSIQNDLPKRRLSRLQNVNHFIVSQTNPHVLPFARATDGSGLVSKAVAVGTRVVRSQGSHALDIVRHVGIATPFGPLLDAAHSMVGQDYGGDIDIHPRFDAKLYRKMFSNAGPEELGRFVLEGERATWPRMAMVRNQTAIGRSLESCIAHLRQTSGRRANDRTGRAPR